MELGVISKLELILSKSSSTFDVSVTGSSEEVFLTVAECGMGVSSRSVDGYDIGNVTVFGLGLEWTVMCSGEA